MFQQCSICYALTLSLCCRRTGLTFPISRNLNRKTRFWRQNYKEALYWHASLYRQFVYVQFVYDDKTHTFVLAFQHEDFQLEFRKKPAAHSGAG